MPEADLILHNANILTMDSRYTHASWVAIRDGKVLALSGKEDFDPLKGAATEVIDCQDMTILPGFHDAHCHPVGFAESLVSPDLSRPTVRSISDIQNKISEVATNTPAGNWIRARGYSEFYLAEKHHPTRWDLDKATTTHPVKLTHRSGHAHVLNSLGLKLAGISIDTTEPSGSIIERDLETGEPNGVLYEMGSYLAEVIPSLTDDEMEQGIRLASEQLVSSGITSVQDASVRNGVQRWQKFQQWKNRGSFKPRISMMIGLEALEQFQERGLLPQTSDNQLQLGSVKIIVHRATGQLNPTQQELNEKVLQIHKLGFQVAMHAVEETTIAAAYLALDYALNNLPRADHRHRIEHCSVCQPEMARLLASLGVAIVTQPAFIYYNGERYLNTVPTKQIEHLYPLATLAKAGLKVAVGSDCPVVPPNPLSGIYAAASRIAETGQSVAPKQRITAIDAIHMYTKGSAYSCFQENIKGSLTPGKLADLIVLSDNPAEVNTEEIKGLEVKMTIIDGKIVWGKEL